MSRPINNYDRACFDQQIIRPRLESDVQYIKEDILDKVTDGLRDFLPAKWFKKAESTLKKIKEEKKIEWGLDSDASPSLDQAIEFIQTNLKGKI